MALVFMPKKTALIFSSIVVVFCLADGTHRKDTTEIIVALVLLLFTIINFFDYRKTLRERNSGKEL